MKRINQYKKLFKVEGAIELKELKKTYRDLVKEWHPDKFQDGDEKAVEAEEKSREIIEGYHFLMSIAPETIANEKEEYDGHVANSIIEDFDHNKSVLSVTFKDGPTYEYFGVSKKLVEQLNNSLTQKRFAKRKIFNSFLYRKAKKNVVVA